MRSLVIGLGLICMLGGFSTSNAQSLFERCEKKKAEIASMEASVSAIDGELANINNQLEDLRRRQRELLGNKTAKVREKMGLMRRIKSERAHQARMCRGLQRCDRLGQQVEDLKQRTAPLYDRLRRIREEIRSRSEESNRLGGEVEKIEASYAQLRCDELVAGQTAQSTIDRCTDLFSNWNKLQSDINALQGSLAGLRDRYQGVMRKMRTQNAQLARLARQMHQTCSHSTHMAELQTMEKEQHEYSSINEDLENMSRRVKKFRALKFRRPKMKPAIKPHKGKPAIQPKHNKKEKPNIRPKNH